MSTPTTDNTSNINEAQFLAPETHQGAGDEGTERGKLLAVEEAEFEVVDDTPFFVPIASDLLDGLLGQYQAARRHIDQLGALVSRGDLANVVHYFIEGNAGDDRLHRSLYVEKLFEVSGAVGALNSAYWSKALALTDVLDQMPQKRRDEWFASIKENKAPDFEETTVRDTITGLLNMRQQFLAERVDGIFRGLSGEHVTNAPEAFGKRMIIAYVLDCYGYSNSGRAGLINDLRCVVAKFMGRDEPKHYASSRLVDALKNRWGEWVSIDGGALRIRLYKKGTAHLDVHPDMAWRLNSILAHMHPQAIPAQFRKKPAKRSKEFKTIDRPLPFAVLELLSERQGARYAKGFSLAYDAKDNRAAYDEAVRVLVSIGGVPDKSGLHFAFEYVPLDVIREICISGCVPDQQSHQFYPTPASVAQAAVELAAIGDADRVLEPSAGHGDLAAFMPIERTRCVEVSELRCSVLKARGFDTVQADFIAWASSTTERFSRVVMNPPYSEGRWRAHTEAAAALVHSGGRLVAILPASARNGFELSGFVCEWSRVFANEFAGTNVSIAILSAVKGS